MLFYPAVLKKRSTTTEVHPRVKSGGEEGSKSQK